MPRNIIVPTELDEAAEKLKVYDVDQGAWEQEPHGYVANATHVLTHLAKGLTTKDFMDGETVQNELAPDSVQYALRLTRWTGRSSLISTARHYEINYVDKRQRRVNFASMPRQQIAYMGATARLAAGLHEEGHEARKLSAAERNECAHDAAQLLMYSASLQAEEFDFDLSAAFDARLANLRERFGIPEPDVV